MSSSTTWAQYLAAWRSRPWVFLLGIGAVALVVVSVVETFARGPLALLFVPGLALVYLHHVIARRTATR